MLTGVRAFAVELREVLDQQGGQGCAPLGIDHHARGHRRRGCEALVTARRPVEAMKRSVVLLGMALMYALERNAQ